MADYEIVEADFQQYYNLDIASLGFRRFARLLVNLPPESRYVCKYSPFKDWNWDREVQSQILHMLDVLAVMYVNSHKKKGSAPLKAPPLSQPQYVLDAKKQLKEQKREESKYDSMDLARIFEERNNQATKLEGDDK